MLNLVFKIHVYSGYIIALLLPFYQRIVPLFIALWAVSFFVSRYNRQYWSHLLKYKSGWISILFFLLSILALTYTEHWDSGVFDIESKLSFLILPLVLSSSVHYYNQRIVKRIMGSFITGLTIASVYCLGLGIYRLVALDAPFQYLTYVDLSVFMHPSYFSMYLSLGVLFLYFIWKQTPALSKYLSLLIVLTVLLFSSTIVLLSSKTGIMVLFLVVLIISIDHVKKKLRLMITLLILLSVFVSVFFTNPRFNSMREQLSNMFDTEQYDENESSALRMVLWRNAYDLIKSNWFIGVGAGDLKYELTKKAGIEKYDSNGNRVYFNAHNQWLETFLSSGIIGFVVILLWLFLPLKGASGEYKFLLIGTFMIIFVNGFFECIFNRQEGIVFTVFFWTLVSLLSRISFHEKLVSKS